VRFLDLPDEPEHPERASVDGAGRSTPKRRELPDPDERGRTYEAMRAHASAERPESHPTRQESRSTTSVPTEPGSEATETRCRASWRCGQATKGAGRRRHGMRRTRRHRGWKATTARHVVSRSAAGPARGTRITGYSLMPPPPILPSGGRRRSIRRPGEAGPAVAGRGSGWPAGASH
jgi:hypothetical protein